MWSGPRVAAECMPCAQNLFKSWTSGWKAIAPCGRRASIDLRRSSDGEAGNVRLSPRLGSQTPSTRRKVTLERTFDATIEDVWELWTTKDGIESWWGPEGFAVEVRKLDLRPGGDLIYAMTATAPDQIEFMKKSGMPLTTETRILFTEIVPQQRLAYTNIVDFVPGVMPYEVATIVEFETSPHGVRMVLTMDAMHDENWTKMAVMGWESELGKLAKLLGERRA